jgi:6-phosphogluconate dehydrogenase
MIFGGRMWVWPNSGAVLQTVSKSFRGRDEGEQCVDFHGVYNAHYVKRYHNE